jgi:hypothetical protein
MKNMYRVFGIIFMVMIIGFVVMGCEDDPKVSDFDGTWISEDDEMKIIAGDGAFTSSQWQDTDGDEEGDAWVDSAKGTYSKDDLSPVECTITHMDMGEWITYDAFVVYMEANLESQAEYDPETYANMTIEEYLEFVGAPTSENVTAIITGNSMTAMGYTFTRE